jgi:hypothetical protein
VTRRDKVVVTKPDGTPTTFRRHRYSVTVVTFRGRRWRNLHTFGSYTPGEWLRVIPRSAKQSRREDLRAGPPTEALGDGTVHLADGLDPKTFVLSVILDALRRSTTCTHGANSQQTADGSHTLSANNFQPISKATIGALAAAHLRAGCRALTAAAASLSARVRRRVCHQANDRASDTEGTAPIGVARCRSG